MLHVGLLLSNSSGGGQYATFCGFSGICAGVAAVVFISSLARVPLTFGVFLEFFINEYSRSNPQEE
jgi:hypothetical protein